MIRSALLVGLGLTILCARPAAAEYEPVTPEDIPRLVSKHARLYPVRPCSNRGPGKSVRLYPGDVVTAAGLYRFGGSDRPSPVMLEVELAGGERQVLHIEDLSRRPLDYSYRAKQSFDAFWTGLVVDAPRLMEQYERIMTRAGHRMPAYDDKKGNWHRLQQLRRQLEFVRMRLFDIAYGHRDERRVLEQEKDWLPARGEEFITEYAGQLPPEKRKRMQDAYGTMNSLANVPSLCAKISELQHAIDEPPADDKYANLEPGHRARLRAEDIARNHTAITELEAKVVVTLNHARANLLAIGIKPR